MLISAMIPPLIMPPCGRGRLRGTGRCCSRAITGCSAFSPELFFTLEHGRLLTRPMKGTALRDADRERDAALADALRADPKQRAENLMIVDLLRNDLSRVAETGSVSVPELFTIESYPTVHQMTSTVTARLREGLDAVDVLRALFPCGSITGAPKIRAMEILHGLETYMRAAPIPARSARSTPGATPPSMLPSARFAWKRE
jgi:anthranilate/para-aminobenzoate synthase component I